MVGKFEGQKWYYKYDILLGDITPVFEDEKSNEDEELVKRKIA